MKAVYRLVPGYFCRFRLQRRWLWIFWRDVAAHDNADHLRETASTIGGTVIN